MSISTKHSIRYYFTLFSIMMMYSSFILAYRKILLTVITVFIVCSASMYAQISPLRAAAPQPIDSIITVQLDFIYGRGLQKEQAGKRPRILSPSARIVMQQFGIVDNDVSALIPGFNEADTILRHSDGYAYRSPNYAHSVLVICKQSSRKNEIITAFKAVPEIHTVTIVERPTIID